MDKLEEALARLERAVARLEAAASAERQAPGSPSPQSVTRLRALAGEMRQRASARLARIGRIWERGRWLRSA